MQFHFQHMLRAIILAVFAWFIVRLHISGEVTMYINPKYSLLSQLAAGLLLVLFVIQVFRIFQPKVEDHHHCDNDCGHDHGYSDSTLKKIMTYSIIIFPLLTGFALPPQLLDSSIAANKGTLLRQSSVAANETAPAAEVEDVQTDQQPSSSSDVTESGDASGENAEHVPDPALADKNVVELETHDAMQAKLKESDTITFDDEYYYPYYEWISMDPQSYVGKTIKISGFVYKEDGLASNQLVLARFAITHCIADASIIGFLAEFDEAENYEKDTWLEIEGTLQMTTYLDMELPVLQVEKLDTIDQPDQPYVYPVFFDMTN
ncbi:TIGR03943 family putative permease subunit [Longirhabdus pacifica]|uniref:TIGR03943 family putative permease subunit n=1 Tax=Longirhabdus pacifica TaxID=2305227 RepID=UPI001008C953|nr:TIGR03943 family protein [Longirhabdus pacifica]